MVLCVVTGGRSERIEPYYRDVRIAGCRNRVSRSRHHARHKVEAARKSAGCHRDQESCERLALPACDPSRLSAVIMPAEKLHHQGRADPCQAVHGVHGRLEHLANHSLGHMFWCGGPVRVVLIPNFPSFPGFWFSLFLITKRETRRPRAGAGPVTLPACASGRR